MIDYPGKNATKTQDSSIDQKHFRCVAYSRGSLALPFAERRSNRSWKSAENLIYFLNGHHPVGMRPNAVVRSFEREARFEIAVRKNDTSLSYRKRSSAAIKYNIRYISVGHVMRILSSDIASSVKRQRRKNRRRR